MVDPPFTLPSPFPTPYEFPPSSEWCVPVPGVFAFGLPSPSSVGYTSVPSINPPPWKKEVYLGPEPGTKRKPRLTGRQKGKSLVLFSVTQGVLLGHCSSPQEMGAGYPAWAIARHSPLTLTILCISSEPADLALFLPLKRKF